MKSCGSCDLELDRLAILSCAVAGAIMLVGLLALTLDQDTRVRRLERTVDSIAGSYPDGLFKEEIR